MTQVDTYIKNLVSLTDEELEKERRSVSAMLTAAVEAKRPRRAGNLQKMNAGIAKEIASRTTSNPELSPKQRALLRARAEEAAIMLTQGEEEEEESGTSGIWRRTRSGTKLPPGTKIRRVPPGAAMGALPLDWNPNPKWTRARWVAFRKELREASDAALRKLRSDVKKNIEEAPLFSEDVEHWKKGLADIDKEIKRRFKGQEARSQNPGKSYKTKAAFVRANPDCESMARMRVRGPLSAPKIVKQEFYVAPYLAVEAARSLLKTYPVSTHIIDVTTFKRDASGRLTAWDDVVVDNPGKKKAKKKAKKRMGKAGRAGIGAGVGALALGPLGAVGGAYLGSRYRAERENPLSPRVYTMYEEKVAGMSDRELKAEHNKVASLLAESGDPQRHFGTEGLPMLQRFIGITEAELDKRGIENPGEPSRKIRPRGRRGGKAFDPKPGKRKATASPTSRTSPGLPATGALPRDALVMFETVFNQAYRYYRRHRGATDGEAKEIAARTAWDETKRYWYKKGEKWIKRKKPLPQADRPHEVELPKDNPLKSIPKRASMATIRGIVSHNIAQEMMAGRPQKQAVAIAIRKAQSESATARKMYPARNPTMNIADVIPIGRAVGFEHYGEKALPREEKTILISMPRPRAKDVHDVEIHRVKVEKIREKGISPTPRNIIKYMAEKHPDRVGVFTAHWDPREGPAAEAVREESRGPLIFKNPPPEEKEKRRRRGVKKEKRKAKKAKERGYEIRRAKKTKRNPDSAKSLISKCQKLWDHYCERPGKTRLQAVFKHLEKMEKSTAKTVKAELRRCKRSARAEAKRLGMKV